MVIGETPSSAAYAGGVIILFAVLGSSIIGIRREELISKKQEEICQ
jgi:hypothetical protein